MNGILVCWGSINKSHLFLFAASFAESQISCPQVVELTHLSNFRQFPRGMEACISILVLSKHSSLCFHYLGFAGKASKMKGFRGRSVISTTQH